MFDVAEAVAPLSPPPLAAPLPFETLSAETAPAEVHSVADSPPPKATASPGEGPARTARRNARIEAFRREQTIVEHLNRGVSLAEIASRLEVDERSLRVDVRKILARRMPETAEEFAAIQASRLNEALLVAYSAMTDGNLKAVDRVLRIVRALDRYCGFSPASLPRLKADAAISAAAGAQGEAPMGLGLGLGGGASLGLGAGLGLGTGAGFDVQTFEAALAALARELGPGAASPAEAPASDDAPASDPRSTEDASPGAGRTIRDHIPQTLENMDSAPGVGARLLTEAAVPAPRSEAGPEAAPANPSPRAGEDAPGTRRSASAGGESPPVSLQAPEKTRFTPGSAALSARAANTGGRPEAGARTPARTLDPRGPSALAMAAAQAARWR